MSFKDGIPLLNTFDDDDTDDDDFTVSTLPRRRKKMNKRHVLFCVVLLGALFLIVALIVGVTVPVVLAKQNTDGGNDGFVTASAPLVSTPLVVSSSEITSVQSMASSAVKSMNVTPSSISLSITVTPSSTSLSIMMTPSSTAVSMNVPPSSTATSIMVTPSSAASIMVPPSSAASIMVTPSSVATSIMVTPSSSTASIMVTPSSTATSIMVTPSSSTASIMVTPSSATPLMTPTPMPTPTPNTNFYQSKLDTRDYQVMTLDNQLRVLLISDPKSNTSAASMDIDAGSFDNPIDTLGLAHFCEHMLFLGTEKYQTEGEYSQYLTQHGGYDNAYTSSENTNYHFNIQSDYLETALDMFAQFFVSPLLTASAVDKEKNAVNAEYQKDILIDGWRTWEVTKDVSNPAHPFHLFDIGSLDTLGGDDLHQKLMDFYNDHYSANKMQLVIYGRDNLTTLSNWTLNSFSNVPNRNLSSTPRTTTSFPPPYSGRIIYHYPVADSNIVSISWQVPSMEKKYRNDISGFLSRYLGQENLGSVLYLLKREGLATSLSAGSQVDTATFSLLYVDVELTDAGLRGVSRVVHAVHAYIGLLRAMNETEFGARFDEYQMMKQNVFDYGVKPTPFTYVKSLASSMRVMDDPEDFLSSPQRLLPNHTHFLSTLECMHPSNAVILVASQSFNINLNVTNATGISSQDHAPLDQSGFEGQIPWPIELDTYEHFFKVPYAIENISAELAEFWSPIGNGFKTLKLPKMNRFIVGDLVVEEKPDSSSAVPMEISAAEGMMSLWWLMDTGDFPEPRVNFLCDIRSANAASSPTWEALSLLFTSDVEAELTANLYDATEVGFTFNLSPTPTGMTFSISGLSNHDNMMTILRTMLEMLLSNKTSELFDASKQGVMDSLSNYNYTEQPYNYARKYIQRVLMERPYWKYWQVLEQMQNLTQADVQSFSSSELLSNVSLLCLAHGNINQTTALSYETVLEQWLAGRLTGGGVVGSFQRSRVQLEMGASYGVSMATLNPEDSNSVVHIIYQIGSVCTLTRGQCDRVSLHNKLYLLLLSQMIGSECFNVLRTEQQLGYVVFCFSRENYGTGSFQVLIQSQAYNASVVYDRINNFLFDYHNSTLSSPSFNETFIEQLSVLRSTLEERDLTLGDRSNRLWAQVNSGQQQFTYNQELVDIINEGSDELNAQSMIDFYEDHILKAQKLVTALNGHGQDFPLPSDLIAIDYSQLNQTSNSFPVQ